MKVTPQVGGFAIPNNETETSSVQREAEISRRCQTVSLDRSIHTIDHGRWTVGYDNNNWLDKELLDNVDGHMACLFNEILRYCIRFLRMISKPARGSVGNV